MKKVKYVVYIFLACVILQVLAYCIPQEKVFQSVVASANQLSNGGIFRLAHGYPTLQMDTLTDSWMLDIASYSGKEPLLKRAFGAFYYDFGDIPHEGGIGPYLALDELAKGNYNLKVGGYSRYWHGYVFFLKIALWLGMTYSDIKLINFIFLFGLFLYLFYLLIQERKELSIPYFMWAIIMGPASFWCLTYAGCMYITFLASIFLIKKKWMKQNLLEIGVGFIIIGLLTSWIDLLTFPLVTLGIPIIFYISFSNIESSRKIIFNILFLAFCWGIGYAGMWFIKWVISSVVLHENVIANAIAEAKYRSSNLIAERPDTPSVSILDVIGESLSIWMKKPYIILFICGIIYQSVKIWRAKAVPRKGKTIGLIIVGGGVPIAWCSFFMNHVYVHYFTFRIWSLSIFALFTFFAMFQRSTLKNPYNGM